MLRFHSEKVTVHHFMNAVIAGNLPEAYRIWKPSSLIPFVTSLRIGARTGYLAR